MPANAGALKERLRRLERYGEGKHHPSDPARRAEASVLILHLADVDWVDASALQILHEVLEDYSRRGALVYLCHLQRHDQFVAFQRAGIIDLIGLDHIQEYASSPVLRAHVSLVGEECVAKGRQVEPDGGPT